MLCGIRFPRRTSPLPLLIELIAVRTSSGLTNEFLGWFTFHPSSFFVPKQEVVCRMKRSLGPASPILIFKPNRWRLVPDLEHVVIVLNLQQKSKFDLVACCLNDALHLFGRIPDRHIASTRTRCSTWGRLANINQ